MSARYVSDAERKLWSDTGYICERDYPRVERLSATIAALLEDGNTLRAAIQGVVSSWNKGDLAEAVNAARVCMAESETFTAQIRGAK